MDSHRVFLKVPFSRMSKADEREPAAAGSRSQVRTIAFDINCAARSYGMTNCVPDIISEARTVRAYRPIPYVLSMEFLEFLISSLTDRVINADIMNMKDHAQCD